MKGPVAKWGNSTAVRLPKAVVKQLGLAPGMTLDVSVDGGAVKLERSAVSEGGRKVASIGRPEPFPVTCEWLLRKPSAWADWPMLPETMSIGDRTSAPT